MVGKEMDEKQKEVGETQGNTVAIPPTSDIQPTYKAMRCSSLPYGDFRNSFCCNLIKIG